MNYNEAIAYINDTNKFGSRLGLTSISKLMDILGNPQDELKIIHVAGTNGKGSTSSYLASCLKAAGYDVGLFTSPYLERFNERIKINGIDIVDDSLTRLTLRVKEACDQMVESGYEHPTTFEIITALAFLYFKEEGVDYVVLEVGLGGRFDATNVIKNSLAAVITTIDYDHMKELGDSLAKIAYEKAGIIKENGIVVSYEQAEEAAQVIRQVSEENKAKLFISKKDRVEILDITDKGNVFNYSFRDQAFENIRTSMIGEHQIYNAALAITTLLVLRDEGLIQISNEHIYEGIFNSRWNGRLEVLNRDPIFLIDGAHNGQGIKQLVKSLKIFNYNRLILGLGILKDKDVDQMIDILAPFADVIVVTEVKMPRKLDAEKLANKLNKYNKEIYIHRDIREAVEKAISLAREDDLILFGGSLYLIGDVRTIVKNLL